MAKRFTDTNKWKDTWFQDLPNKYKLFWIYLLDECDAAGLWKPNMRLAQFQVGEPFEEAELKRVFSDRIEITDSGYWFIRKFIEFQYGELSPSSKPHNSVIKLLEKHKIKGYPKGIHTLKDKEQDKDKDKESYATAENAFSEWQNDELFVAQVGRAIRPYWRACDEAGIGSIMKRFLVTIEPSGKLTDNTKREIKQYLINWVNSKGKDIHEYAK